MDEVIRRVGELPEPEPTTQEELEAMPEVEDRHSFTVTCPMCNCKNTLHVPYIKAGCVTPRNKDSILFFTDKNGNTWRPELGQDGIWYKRHWVF